MVEEIKVVELDQENFDKEREELAASFETERQGLSKQIAELTAQNEELTEQNEKLTKKAHEATIMHLMEKYDVQPLFRHKFLLLLNGNISEDNFKAVKAIVPNWCEPIGGAPMSGNMLPTPDDFNFGG